MMQSSSRVGLGRSATVRRLSRSGAMVLGSLALAVLPACSPEEATTASTDTATATESVSSTTPGGEGEQRESSSSSTDESAVDDGRDATGSATSDEGSDDADTSTVADEGATTGHPRRR